MNDMTEHLDIEGVFNFEVEDLKNELAKRGLSTIGTKSDLQERLLQYMDNSVVNGDKSKDSAEESLDKSDLLEESLDTVMNLDNTKDSNITIIDTTGNCDYEDIDIDVDIIIEKSDSSKKTRTCGVDVKKGRTIKCNQGKSVPTVVKISLDPMTNGEKKENRSKRFGEASSESEKKKLRLGRFSSSVSGPEKGTVVSAKDKLKARTERFSSSTATVTNAGSVMPTSTSTSTTTISINTGSSTVDRLKSREERFADVNLKKRQERFGTTHSRSLNLNPDMKVRKQKRMQKFGTVQ